MGESPQLRVSDFAPFAYNILQNCPIVLPACALSRAHFNPARSSRTPEVCTLQETAVRPTLARRHFRYGQLLVLPHFDTFRKLRRTPAQRNDIASRGKSQTAISEKSEKRISDGCSSWMHLERYVYSALREMACMRSGRCRMQRPSSTMHRADPPDACMHPRCVTLVFYRVKHRGGCVGRFTRTGWFRGETTRKDRERDGSGIRDIQAEWPFKSRLLSDKWIKIREEFLISLLTLSLLSIKKKKIRGWRALSIGRSIEAKE